MRTFRYICVPLYRGTKGSHSQGCVQFLPRMRLQNKLQHFQAQSKIDSQFSYKHFLFGFFSHNCSRINCHLSCSIFKSTLTQLYSLQHSCTSSRTILFFSLFISFIFYSFGAKKLKLTVIIWLIMKPVIQQSVGFSG